MRKSDDGEDVYRQVGWMVAADPVFLEFLDSARDRQGNPSIQTPKTIARNTGFSRKHASARCQELSRYGLVEYVDEGEYRLTDYGVRAVAGEISLEELDDLEPEALDRPDGEGGSN